MLFAGFCEPLEEFSWDGVWSCGFSVFHLSEGFVEFWDSDGVHVNLVGACDGGGGASVVSEWGGGASVASVVRSLGLQKGYPHLRSKGIDCSPEKPYSRLFLAKMDRRKGSCDRE